MATITAAAGGGAWSSGGTWVGSVAPGSGDDVLLTGTSGNVTVDAGAACRSLNCTGYTGTLTHTAGVTLSIGDGTAGLASVALTLVAGMTYTLGDAATSAILFTSTSVTQQTVAAGGKTLGNVTFGGGSGTPSYLLSDGFTNGATATTTLTRGTLNTNGKTCSWGSFSSSNSNTRTLTLGASAITIAGTGTAWDTGTATGLSVTANTAIITFTNASGAQATTGGINWGGASLVFQSNIGSFGGGTVANITINGSATKTGSVFGFSNSTITGTLTVAGNSAVNRVFIISNGGVGVSRTITAATVSLTNVDFQDITGAGAATWSGTSIGDCQGNSGITFTTATTQTNTGATGNWSDATKWTSRVPLPQDTVVVNTGSGTITADMPLLGGSISFSGFTGKFARSSTANTVFGSLTYASGMSVTGTQAMTFAGRSSYTITRSGIVSAAAHTLVAPGGTYTMQDDFNISTATLTISNGTWVANGHNVTCGTVSSNGTATRGITTGTGTWSLGGTGTVWNLASTGMTFTGGTATIVVTDTSSSSKTFAGAGFSYGTLRQIAAGTGAFLITGNNTFVNLDLECSSNRTVTLPAGGNQTVTGVLTLAGT